MKPRWVVTEISGGLRAFDPYVEREISEHWFFWMAWLFAWLWVDLHPYRECVISRKEHRSA